MSSSDIEISVRGLSKSYTISHNGGKHATLAETLIHTLRHPFRQEKRETFWALKDVSFDIKKGDVVGLIGRNGAGKSTLLKILSRITEPTSGRIHLYGRVGSLLEVGTGFHPQLSGRENIYLNGSILGMKKPEIRKQFDAIVDFAGVEKFLDTPVKRYSNGMYMRLAFAVAAHLETEILMVDEVLSVGDLEFQRKCLGKMKDVASGGRTVVFVSHQMQSVRALCDRAIFMQNGQCSLDGSVEECVGKYLDSFKVSQNEVIEPTRRPGSGEHRLISASASKEYYECAEPKVIRFSMRKFKPFNGKLHLSALLLDEAGNTLLHLDSRMVGHWVDSAESSSGELVISNPWLKPGQYRLNLLICSNGIQDKFEGACQFQVVPLLPYPSGFANPEATALGMVFADYAYRSIDTSDATKSDVPRVQASSVA
jgi:lipopolysaccharide transport system ATP-binding protein